MPPGIQVLATLPASICSPSIQKVEPVTALPVSIRSPIVVQLEGMGWAS